MAKITLFDFQAVQENRTFIPVWSSAPAPDSILSPLWDARHPAAIAYALQIRHACISTPVHDLSETGNELLTSRQVQLICMFNFVRDDAIRAGTRTVYPIPPNAFGSYLVRIMGDGSRRSVQLAWHTTPFASSSIFYDASFNSVYVSTFVSASFSGKKHVLKVLLMPSYNFTVSSSQTIFLPSGWIMPVNSNTYPDGMSLDYASVEPLSSSLLFYAPTLKPDGSFFSILYYIPSDEYSRGIGYVPTGQRSMQPVMMEDEGLSPYARKTMQPVSTVYNPSAGATLVFTIYAGPMARFGWVSGPTPFRSILHCSPCPERYTSYRGAASVYDCFCKPGTYLNAETGACTPITRQCPPLHFISRLSLPGSDTQCTPCYTCPLGFYRDPYDCQSHVYRDPAKPVQCIPCTSCAPGYYINPDKCRPNNIYDANPRTDCIPCNRWVSFFMGCFSRELTRACAGAEKCRRLFLWRAFRGNSHVLVIALAKQVRRNADSGGPHVPGKHTGEPAVLPDVHCVVSIRVVHIALRREMQRRHEGVCYQSL